MDTYIKRHAEQAVRKISSMFGGNIGCRSAAGGEKTTMLQKITEGINYVTLDDLIVVKQCTEEKAEHFPRTIHLPVFVDEIQKAPELFPYIKMPIDCSLRKAPVFYVRFTAVSDDEGCQRIFIGTYWFGDPARTFFA